MKIYLSDDHLAHFPRGELYGGELVRPFECPERHAAVVAALARRGHADHASPAPLDRAVLARVHSRPYLEFLAVAWDEWVASGAKGEAIPSAFAVRGLSRREPREIDGRIGHYAFAAETAITEGTWRAAQGAAALAGSAARHVADGARAAFALCRPPGHHAAADLFGGYCFLNNAAIAAETLLAAGASRVAVLDVDFHHGNGTQSIFETRADVLFVSLHGDPLDAFPYFLGHADETGVGAGEGFTLNLPLPRGTAWSEWSAALERGCERIARHAPDALVVSLGVDAFEKDPISFFRLGGDDFTRCGERVGALALPTVFVMEGGYAVAEVGDNVVNVLEGFETASR